MSKEKQHNWNLKTKPSNYTYVQITLFSSSFTSFHFLTPHHSSLPSTRLLRSENHLGNDLWSKSTTRQQSSLTCRMLTALSKGTITTGHTWFPEITQISLERKGSMPAAPKDPIGRRYRPSLRPVSPNYNSRKGSSPPSSGRDGKPFQ